MGIDPIACTLLTAASVSTGLRRMGKAKLKGSTLAAHYMPSKQDQAISIAAQRHRARLMNISDSAIDQHIESARARGQSDLLALQGLISGTGTRQR